MKTLKFFALFLGIGFGITSCSDDDTKTVAEPQKKMYPVSLTRTANYNTDTLRSEYTYNDAHQIIREDVFKNRNLERYNLYRYNAAGKPDKFVNYDATGSAIEQSEITYNADNQPDRLSHGYLDAAGQLQPHHYRIHEFDASGKITRWTDHMASGAIMNSRTYSYPASSVILSPVYGANNQLLNTSEITLDGKPQPFQNTAFNLITLGSNEIRHVVKDTAGLEISAYSNAITYNATGFPVFITQTHTDGTIKTEKFAYKTE